MSKFCTVLHSSDYIITIISYYRVQEASMAGQRVRVRVKSAVEVHSYFKCTVHVLAHSKM